jgi:hypothetical protein
MKERRTTEYEDNRLHVEVAYVSPLSISETVKVNGLIIRRGNVASKSVTFL